MPSTATITAFYSFTGGTKARATQVNNNFDVFRGHIIPISATTQTAADLTYDLGSTTYYWRAAHVGGFSIANDTTTGLGDLVFSQGGVESARLAKGSGSYTMSAAFSAGISTSTSSTISSLTINGYGKPMEISLIPSLDVTSSGSGILLSSGGGFTTPSAFVSLLRNGTTIATSRIGGIIDVKLPLSALRFLDYSAPSGSIEYTLNARVSPSITSISFTYAHMFIKQYV